MSDIVLSDLRLHFGGWIIAPTGMAVQVSDNQGNAYCAAVPTATGRAAALGRDGHR
jgi:hypothetical protein